MAVSAAAEAAPTTLAYGPGGEAQTLDLYRPAGQVPAPLIVYVHGGGWRQGDKQGGWRIAEPLVARGYAVASINYRLTQAAPIADQAADVAAAAVYLLAHAADYAIDPKRYALMGHSAGGHLVALVATDPAYARAAGLDLRALAAVVTLDGVFNLDEAVAAHTPTAGNPALSQAMSPIAHVAGVVGHPLFCLVHEDTNPRFASQADDFAARLRAAGHGVDEPIVHGLRHGPLAGQFAEPGIPTAGLVEACLERAFKPR